MSRKNAVYNFNFHILVGLPGSGKSYFAQKEYGTDEPYFHSEKHVIDFDSAEKTGDFRNDVWNALTKNRMKEIYCRGYYENCDICFDGLITTLSRIKELMNIFIDYMAKYSHLNYKIKFIIHRWNEDRETCIFNDIKRVNDGVRKDTSKLSISNIPFDDFDFNDFSEYIDNEYISDIVIKRHEVKKTTTYDTIFYPLISKDRSHSYGGYYRNEDKPCKTKYMYSEDWSGGGTWGNCWGEEGSISADEPNNFDELDNLLQKICPNITYLQYKKIEKECVDIEESYEHDYYGGTEQRNRWRCDMEKLYQLLKEMNFITEY